MKCTNIGATIVIYCLIETNLVKCDIIHLSFNHSTSQAYIRPLRINLSVGASQLKDKKFRDNFKKKLSIDANKTNTIYDGETGANRNIEGVSFKDN